MKKLLFISALIFISCSKGESIEEEVVFEIPKIDILISKGTCASAFITTDGVSKTNRINDVRYGQTVTLYAEPTESAPYVNGYSVWYYEKGVPDKLIPGSNDLPRNQTESQWKVSFNVDIRLIANCSDTYYP